MFDTNFPMHYTGVRDGKMEKDGKNKSQKSFDTNFPIYYIGVRDGKKEKWKKKAKINHRILVFFLTIYLAPLTVYTKFEDSGCDTS